MYLSQMIFMSDLPAQEMENLGTAFFDKEQAKEIEEIILEQDKLPEEEEIRLRQEREEHTRILKCAVGMYLQAQSTIKKFVQEVGFQLYLTPAHFLQIFEYHQLFFDEKKDDTKTQLEMYNRGLKQILDTQEVIYNYHKMLEKKGP